MAASIERSARLDGAGAVELELDMTAPEPVGVSLPALQADDSFSRGGETSLAKWRLSSAVSWLEIAKLPCPAQQTSLRRTDVD